MSEKEEGEEEEKQTQYPDIFDSEYTYTIDYIRSSCDNCGIRFKLDTVIIYLIKERVLLCEVCYRRIFVEHVVKRKLEWVGRRVFQRKIGKRPY